MSDYQERVRSEFNELSLKQELLVEFMHGDIFPKLPAVEQGLLMVQLSAMDTYVSTLARRIELF